MKKIYIANSKIKGAGRGVFAGENIPKGEIIEICPFVEISEGDPANRLGSHLVTYFFYFGKNKERVALVLGYGSLYNHSANPNAVYIIKPKDGVVIFTATKDIKKDSEITFDYRGSGKNSKISLWFEVK
jgi:hypothetical protein